MSRAELAKAIAAARGAVEEVSEPSGEALEETADDAHVYAIVRLSDRDDDPWSVVPGSGRVTVEKVVGSEDEAERETERLNALAQSQEIGASYFWQLTRLESGSGA